MKTRALLFLAILTTMLTAGCSSVYYGAMEKVGIHKRDILVDRVDDARKSQEDAKKQFASALDQFIAITKVDAGGDLESKYNKLSDGLKRSEERAKAVNERIASVSDVAEALFSEWKKELSQYSDAGLRSQSEAQLKQTRARYEDLMRTMRAAAARMDPILVKFRDQVLFLKHNLNARAVAGLSATSVTLQSDVSGLIADMEKSIAEADAFINSMKTQ